MTTRKASRVHPMTKIACPVCAARITVDPISRGPIQCPRCLNQIDLSAPRPPTLDPSTPHPPTPVDETIGGLHERIDRLEQEREQRLALQSDLELLASENVNLKSTIEGLQAERAALLKKQQAASHEPPLPPAVSTTPRMRATTLEQSAAVDAAATQRLRDERDVLALKLRDAESALADTARILMRFQDLEQRISDIGAAYVRALEHSHKLEEEIRKRK